MDMHGLRAVSHRRAQAYGDERPADHVSHAHGECCTRAISRYTRARASDALKILIKRARRKFTKSPIEYLAVFEETKKGEPHLHILMRAPFIPQRWLSETMDELINAPIVDIRKVGAAKNAARYVAKYVGKGPKPFAALKRYWLRADTI